MSDSGQTTTRPRPRMTLRWDLSRSHRISDVDWPADLARPDRILEGDIDFSLKLPGGQEFKGEMADIRLERKDNDLYLVHARSHAMTLDEAHAQAEKLIRQFGFPRKNLDAWHKGVKSGDPQADQAFATRRNDVEPALSLELLHSYDPDQPWYVSFKVVW